MLRKFEHALDTIQNSWMCGGFYGGDSLIFRPKV
jgi:hypothetical protein